MKRSSKAALAFLVVWLVVLMTGYLLSRSRAFAAGGKQSCPPCEYCEEFSQFTNGVNFGYTAVGTNTPWVASALNGTGSGGSLDLFGIEECYISWEAMENTDPVTPLTIWKIKNGQDTCQPAQPPPNGVYEWDNSQIDVGDSRMNQNGCYPVGP